MCLLCYHKEDFIIIIFNRSLLEYNCFTILCQFLLYNKVKQPYAYIYLHIPFLLSLPPTLPIPPLQVIAKHRGDLPVLCCCFPLANYLHSVVYICRCYSHFATASPSPLHRVLKSILYVCVFIPALPLGSSVPFFFKDYIYMRQHMVFVFLFLTYFTLYDRLQVHPPHYK